MRYFIFVSVREFKTFHCTSDNDAVSLILFFVDNFPLFFHSKILFIFFFSLLNHRTFNNFEMAKRIHFFTVIYFVYFITGTLSLPQSSDPSTDDLISELFTKEPAVDVSRSGTEENVCAKIVLIKLYLSTN